MTVRSAADVPSPKSQCHAAAPVEVSVNVTVSGALPEDGAPLTLVAEEEGRQLYRIP